MLLYSCVPWTSWTTSASDFFKSIIQSHASLRNYCFVLWLLLMFFPMFFPLIIVYDMFCDLNWYFIYSLFITAIFWHAVWSFFALQIVRLLANHPYFSITMMTADRKAGQSIESVFPHLVTQVNSASFCSIHMLVVLLIDFSRCIHSGFLNITVSNPFLLRIPIVPLS